MKDVNTALLAPDERIKDKVAATLEVNDTYGTNYTFGSLIATNKKLVLSTRYPLIRIWETTVYHYQNLARIEISQHLFSFNDDVTVTIKLVNKGNAKQFLETMQLHSTVPGIRNFHQNSTGI